MTPPAPIPAIALPMMKAIELGAAAQIVDPTMNTRIDPKNVVLIGMNLYNFPNSNWKAALVSKYAVPYQPISFGDLKSFVICGIAVEIISLSYRKVNLDPRQHVADKVSDGLDVPKIP